MAQKRLPFEGVRVCDFTWYAAGPIATKYLAHFGAQVIKMESTGQVDKIRIASPQVPGKEKSLNVGGWHSNVNSDKLDLGLNLRSPRARDVYHRLIMISDIVVENFSPRTKEALGLNYEDYVKLKPDIIWVDQPMQGLTGPHKYRGGFGATITALAGLSYLTGFPHRPPMGTGTQYTDYVVNPGQLAIAIVGALRRRQRTGKGQHIVMSQYASSVSILETAILDYTVNNRVQSRNGNRIPYAAPHGCYRCKGEDREAVFSTPRGPKLEKKDDRWCVIAVFTDEEWGAFCDVIGNPSWTKDPKFATLLGRKKNEDELDELVQSWTGERSPEEVMILMQRTGVPAGVVQDGEDVLIRDPHIRARGYYVYLDHPEAGHTAYDGLPFRLSATPGELRTPAPRIAEHTEFVCKEILHMADDEFDELLVEGVIEIG